MCKAICLALLVSAMLTGQTGKIPSPTFRGTLKILDNQEIVLQLEADQTVSIRRTRKTKFLRNDKEVKPSDIAVGTAIEVDVTEGPDLKPVALRVVVKATAPAS